MLYETVVMVIFRSKPTNQSTEAGEHGESSEEGGHDVCASERNSGLPALWAILYILVVLFLFIGKAIIKDVKSFYHGVNIEYAVLVDCMNIKAHKESIYFLF